MSREWRTNEPQSLPQTVGVYAVRLYHYLNQRELFAWFDGEHFHTPAALPADVKVGHVSPDVVKWAEVTE